MIIYYDRVITHVSCIAMYSLPTPWLQRNLVFSPQCFAKFNFPSYLLHCLPARLDSSTIHHTCSVDASHEIQCNGKMPEVYHKWRSCARWSMVKRHHDPFNQSWASAGRPAPSHHPERHLTHLANTAHITCTCCNLDILDTLLAQNIWDANVAKQAPGINHFCDISILQRTSLRPWRWLWSGGWMITVTDCCISGILVSEAYFWIRRPHSWTGDLSMSWVGSRVGFGYMSAVRCHDRCRVIT